MCATLHYNKSCLAHFCALRCVKNSTNQIARKYSTQMCIFTVVLRMRIRIARDCKQYSTVCVLYFCHVAAAFSLSEFQTFLEARGLKTNIYKAASLKVVLRATVKLIRSPRITTQDVSELLRENNMLEIQVSCVCYYSDTQTAVTTCAMSSSHQCKTGFKRYQKVMIIIS